MIKRLIRECLPAPVWDRLRQNKARAIQNSFEMLGRELAGRYPRLFQQSLEKLGFAVTPISYYSTLPTVSELKATAELWNRPSAMAGVDFKIEEMEATLAELLSRYREELEAIPSYDQLRQVGYGPGFTELDARILYLIVRHLKPNRYFEVGSGLSTYYCSLAAARNAEEGHPLGIVCIEPNPYERLYSIPGIEIIPSKVEQVEVSLFGKLQANDILFIDSSHVLRVGGEVAHLYLEVLPTLNPGVVVHVHDIHFPYNFPYPPEKWIFNQDYPWPFLWNEAMLLQAFLCFNSRFRLILSAPLIRHFDEGFLRRNVHDYKSVDQESNTFGSAWLRRVS